MPVLRKVIASLLAMAIICVQAPQAQHAAPLQAVQGAGLKPAATGALNAVPYFTEPSVAPDRAEIAFVSGGDIWTAGRAGIKTGEYVLAVEKKEIDARTNLDELLNFTIGKKIEVTVATSSDAADKRDVAVQPVNLGTEKQLLYRKWVEERRAYVERASGGRLGYVHMPDMGAGSLAQLYVDLDTLNHAKDGVVIDVRNNNGGFVNVYAIDVLARRPYLQMQPRGFPGIAPARTVLGQRALESPTILVVNQHSLSDAEDFTEGYRALKLGKVVGEPTAGWIIYTSGATLLDGTNLRIPFIRVTTAEGKPMEMYARPVDIPVTRPIGESYTEKDSQLDAAVGELLKQIGKK